MMALIKGNTQFRIFLGHSLFASLGGGIFSMFMLLSMHMIYRNPLYTGITGFLMSVPFIFSFAVGPIVDRKNKVNIIRITTFIEIIVLAMLIFIMVQGDLSVIYMFVLIFIYSVTVFFMSPAGNALIPHIVDEDKIMEANASIQTVSYLGGLAIAFIIMTFMGDMFDFTYIFGLSGGFLVLSFVFTLFLKNPKNDTSEHQKTTYIMDLKEGVTFLRRNVLLYIVIIFVVMAVITQVSIINMPEFIEYHAGARGYILVSVVGMIGGVIASTVVGIFGKHIKIGLLFLFLFVLAGIMRIVFVQVIAQEFNVALMIVVLFATFRSASGVVYRSLEQKIPPKDMVGRIDTLTTTVFAIFTALAALIGGVAGRLVPQVDYIFIFQGISLIVIGFVFMLVPGIRKLPRINDLSKESDDTTTDAAETAE